MMLKNKSILWVILSFLMPMSGFSGTLQQLAAKFGKDLKNTDTKIAVMDFSTGETGNNQDSIVVRERITTFLAQTKNITLIERSLLEKVFQEQKIQVSGAVGADTAKKIGELTGANAIVSGTLSELTNDEFELNARIIEVATGKVISAGQAVFKKDWKYFKPLNINTAEKVATDSAQDYYRRGTQYHNDGKYNMALEFYSKALKLKPDYLEAYNARGNLYALKGKYDEAVIDFNRVIELKMDSVEGYSGRAMAFSAKGDYDRAIQDFDKTIELTPISTTSVTDVADGFLPDDPDYIGNYIKRGNTYLDKSDPDRAIRDYTKVIEFRPDSEYFHTLRGRAYRIKGDYPRAIADYTQAIKLSSTTASNYINRGEVYFAKMDFDAAINDYTKAIMLLPKRKNASVLEDLPPLWEDTLPVKAGGETYSLDYVQDDDVLYSRRGFLYVLKDEYAKAIKDCNKAIGINPKSAQARYLCGLAYNGKGEHEKALSDFNMAMKLEPEPEFQHKVQIEIDGIMKLKVLK